MPLVESVNVGVARATAHSDIGFTGIDKRPVDGPVEVRAPRARGASGVITDTICDARSHGGPDQAVYAYAREDLDEWAARLGRDLPSGFFGENLTTREVDVSGALIGERWRAGTALLEVSVPRIPCRTFAGWLAELGWVRTFTRRAAPGAYLRVIEPGVIRAGDPVGVVHRPDHEVSIATAFRALTTAPELLPLLVDVEALPVEARARAARRTPFALDA
jgi:MOSC domain-containing protein YiiM